MPRGETQMTKRTFDRAATFQSIRNTAEITGLAQGFVRAGCKNGTIPHILCGKEYRVNVPLFLEQLQAESTAHMKGASTT